MSNPEFVVYTGPMFGGKTTRLLSEVERYRHKGKTILAFKPTIDSRYYDEYIVTHNGLKVLAKKILHAEEMLITLDEGCPDNQIVVVDEAFMIKDIGEILPIIFQKGWTVLASTLQLSASGRVFDEVEKILPWATKVVVCPAVCTMCSNDAFYTFRKVDGLEEIAVGGNDLYEPRCFKHYFGGKHDKHQ